MQDLTPWQRPRRASAGLGERGLPAELQVAAGQVTVCYLAAAIMPAPTVSFVASSIRMNEPVARFSA